MIEKCLNFGSTTWDKIVDAANRLKADKVIVYVPPKAFRALEAELLSYGRLSREYFDSIQRGENPPIVYRACTDTNRVITLHVSPQNRTTILVKSEFKTVEYEGVQYGWQ